MNSWRSPGRAAAGRARLMHLIGGLDTPTSGEVHVNGLALHRAGDAELTEYRRRSLGIVFQFFNLLPTMTVLENVSLPLLLAGKRLKTAQEAAKIWLERPGWRTGGGIFPPALRRGNAADGNRPGAGTRAGGGAGRRTDGKPGFRERGAGDGNAAKDCFSAVMHNDNRDSQ